MLFLGEGQKPLRLFKATRFYIKTVRTVFAAALAAITSFEVVLFGKDHKTFITHVIITGFELGHKTC